MAVEAVVGQDAAQIGMASNSTPKKVVDLALEPVGGGKDADRRGIGVASSVSTITRTRRLSLGESR